MSLFTIELSLNRLLHGSGTQHWARDHHENHDGRNGVIKLHG
jgi:hypothetical protein